ncbi:helix-turn-helix domain-containing protein [Halomonas sp. EGI 63088]|uniref:Helix-turn-helix domain-containing protein n=1 Tax=Halomonas flagellata TaxID=2920385 RepID=A0ABS9RUL4_9GAMM|nr:helix-turn-helix domain-containing protein [Halomonas flagellata]MCH4563556.1 helix-turn-helix domain-containing protein [Halomonas flagellata]
MSCLHLPLGLPLEEIPELHDAETFTLLRKDEVLFEQGTPFAGLFLVRSGSLKQVSTIHGGDPLVMAYAMPGDLVGLDAIGQNVYPGTALALETLTVSVLSQERVSELGAQVPELRQQLCRNLSQEVHDERLMLRSLLHRTAVGRLAYFFVAMSMRFRRRGYSPTQFRLALSRSDIASYLGLTVETISRTLAHFHKQELLKASGRDFHILDLDELIRLAESSGRRGGR